MRRRKFLHTAAGNALSVPFLLNGIQLSANSNPLFNLISREIDRTLIIIQLNGGNDGLNTIIPLDQYDGLSQVRKDLLIPSQSALTLTDTVGLHPAMKTLKWMFDDEKMGVVQSVGYPNSNRSHFRSTDIWMTGSPADEFWETGWLGRSFDKRYPGFPENYPNPTDPDPIAITIGPSGSPETCQGEGGNFSMNFINPFNLGPLDYGNDDEVENSKYGRELSFLRTKVSQTNEYSKSIINAANTGNNLANYPSGNRLAEQLKNVALMISGGLKTKVYILGMGGFDTHANQVIWNNPTAGEHSNLLKSVSDAVSAFLEDLEMLGLQDRVIGVTMSEFGRQIFENGSRGSDHGDAAPLILFGSCVKNQILGDNPEIDPQVDQNAGVPMQYDFRDVYGSILMDWFNIDEGTIKEVFHQDFQHLDIVSPCNTTVTSINSNVSDADIALQNFPNPFNHWTTISFESENEWVKLSIYDALGKELQVIVNKQLPKGKHQFNWETRGLPAGHYFYRLQLGRGITKTKRMIKQ